MITKDEILKFLAKNRGFFKSEYNIIRIGIFGSFSRGDQNIDSDIDLIVEFEENTEELYDKKLQLKDFIKRNLNLEADVCREKYIKPKFKKNIVEETDFAY
jgi:predicted nucleotidyltransferase